MVHIDEKILESVGKQRDDVFPLIVHLSGHLEASCGGVAQSGAAIIEFLEQRGYEVTSHYGGVDGSFKAARSDQKGGMPRAALLCEYDTLADAGHGRGYPVGCCIGVLTALALSDADERFPMEIDLVGTPAAGKAAMAAGGAFEGYDLAVAVRPGNQNVPQLRFCASTGMRITFCGKSAHVSGSPWESASAFGAAQLFVHASDMLRQHLPADYRLRGFIEHSQPACEDTPDHVSLNYSLQADSLMGLDDLWQRMGRCAEGASVATGATYTAKPEGTLCADLTQPLATMSEIAEIFEALSLPWEMQQAPAGPSDVGSVDVIIPTICMGIRTADGPAGRHGEQESSSLSSERNLRTIENGANVVAHFLNEMARDPAKLARFKEEQRAYRSNPQNSAWAERFRKGRLPWS